MNVKKFLAIAIILLFVSVSVIPSTGTTDVKQSIITTFINDGSLSGYVNDTSMNPLAGTLVRVYFHGTYEEDFTDSSGYYHVTNIPICNCTKNCTAFKSGYKPAWTLLGIGKNTTYDFVLTSGNKLYVGGTANNYSRIQDAINAANDGDTIFVYDDSSPYYENLVVNKSIILIGENKNTTIIDGGGSGDVVYISADFVSINGFTIEDSGDDYSNHDAGIKLLSNGNIITDTYIIHNREGVYLSSSNSNNISNNSINYNRNAIRLHDASTHNRISGNTIITWSSSFGVYIENSSDNNMIFQNTITNPDGWALYILESQENNISDNTVMKSEYGISMVYSNDSIISNNFLKQNEYSGISLTGSRDNIISQNTFEFDGLFLWNSYHNTVSDNTVNGKPLVYFEDKSDMTVPGNAGQIILVNCNNILIENQDIKNTSVGIELWYSDNCEISRNILTNNKGNIYLRNANNTRINQNTLMSNESYIFRHSLELRECVGTSITQNDFSSTVEYPRLFIYNSHYNNISGNNFSDEFNGVSICHHSHDNNIIENIFSSKSSVTISISRNNHIIRNSNVGGISIYASDSNTVSENSISTNYSNWGVSLEDSHQNTVSSNDIRNSDGAIFLVESKSNIVSKNNIIACGTNPVWFSNFPLLNRWSRNYWGRPILGPKLIRGEIRIHRDWPFSDIVIPWFDFDWRPALKPYDIGV